MATIRVTIDKFGNPKISAEGFKGVACDKATKALEETLRTGAASSKKTRKPEFFENVTAANTVKVGG